MSESIFMQKKVEKNNLLFIEKALIHTSIKILYRKTKHKRKTIIVKIQFP